MAKRGKTLNLDEKTCRLGKISNNLEKHGGEWVTAFTIPFSGLMLTKPELNTFMRDKYTWQSWFDTSKAGAPEPMVWWGGESFYVSETFEADTASIKTSADKPLEFESEGDPKDDDKYRPAMTVEKIVLTPQQGGFVEVRGSLYCRPGIGRINLALQDHQHREVKLTLVNARVAERAKRQPQLPLGDAGSAAPESATATGSSAGADAAAPH